MWGTVGVKGSVLEKMKAIKEAGASLRSLDVRKPNLEEVFLKLTGESVRDATSSEVESSRSAAWVRGRR